MTEKYTAAQWAEIEGGHTVTIEQEESFSFLKDLHESRMTKDNGSSQRLTYTDCGERMYLTLLALETMRQYSQFAPVVQKYCKKTVGFDRYKFYRIMGTDLYNFIYFLVGDDSAQNKLKDPDAARIQKNKTNVPVADINRHMNAVATGKVISIGNMFIRIESGLNITNADYKSIRRGLQNFNKLTRAEKRLLVTRLIFAVRAKLRNSDIIDDFEKFAAIKNLEKTNVNDPEPTISTPDISTYAKDIALYRYLVGAKNLALVKTFLNASKNGKSVNSAQLRAYLPAIEMIDDIVQGGPAMVQQLRTLQNRAKKTR